MVQGQTIAVRYSEGGIKLNDVPMKAGETTQKGALLMADIVNTLFAADDAAVASTFAMFAGVSLGEYAALEVVERFLPNWFDCVDASASLVLGEKAYLETPTTVTDAAGATENHFCGIVIAIAPGGVSGEVRVAPFFAIA